MEVDHVERSLELLNHPQKTTVMGTVELHWKLIDPLEGRVRGSHERIPLRAFHINFDDQTLAAVAIPRDLICQRVEGT